MRILLDTQIVVWAFDEPEILTAPEAEAIRSSQNIIFISIVTPWEIAIKSGLGKLAVPSNLPELIRSRTDLRLLPIELTHVWRVRELPMLHKDPFDRLLVAQAMIEGLTLMTRDRVLENYDVPIFNYPA